MIRELKKRPPNDTINLSSNTDNTLFATKLDIIQKISIKEDEDNDDVAVMLLQLLLYNMLHIIEVTKCLLSFRVEERLQQHFTLHTYMYTDINCMHLSLAKRRYIHYPAVGNDFKRKSHSLMYLMPPLIVLKVCLILQFTSNAMNFLTILF
ncbi:hypothetical protein FF38_04726 [Lucilia cuprina]|uniref:Uncharacterized protein n=1 Tax=Lucilia cuprina TaxID=7375 RepID=A0A0L0CLJ0_LUCCU|nr:hypothetical protein FF38_04726 [Lucilia cuprina]